jgi:hypothetical protein
MRERNHRVSTGVAIPPVPAPLPDIHVTGIQTVPPDKLTPGSSGHPREKEPSADVRRAFHNVNLSTLLASVRKAPAVDATLMHPSLRAAATGRIMGEGGKMGPFLDPSLLPKPPRVPKIEH